MSKTGTILGQACRNWAWALATVVGLGSQALAASPTLSPGVPQCSSVFASTLSPLIGATDEGFKSDGVLITSHPFTGDIDNALGLDQRFLSRIANQKLKVISVGEGFSGLLPELLRRSIDAYGVDLWYHSKDAENLLKNSTDDEAKAIKEYLDRYGKRLINGDARELPFTANSVDIVLSHKLVNNLHIADQLKFLAEAVRVLRPSGEARIDLYPAGEFDGMITEELYHHVIASFLKRSFGDAIEFKFRRQLLTLRKLKDLGHKPQPVIPFEPDQVYRDLPYGNLYSEENMTPSGLERGIKGQPVLPWDHANGTKLPETK